MEVHQSERIRRIAFQFLLDENIPVEYFMDRSPLEYKEAKPVFIRTQDEAFFDLFPNDIDLSYHRILAYRGAVLFSTEPNYRYVPEYVAFIGDLELLEELETIILFRSLHESSPLRSH